MSSRHTMLKPLFRWFAAVTLMFWIGAQALCQVHCLSAGCDDESSDADRLATSADAPHHGDHDETPQPGHHDCDHDASCLALKSALVGNSDAPVITAQLSFLYALTPLTLALDVTAIEPLDSFSRQDRLREWVFTPEVCLGPAFRSHAPPFSSLA